MTTLNHSATTEPVQSVGVLIITFRRKNDLARCLTGLEAQTRNADEVVIVVREDDEETRGYLNARSPDPLPLHVVFVQSSGIISARNAGLHEVRSDLIAMIDDDAVPRPDWLARIFDHFATNPRLGGLGGRDQCYLNGQPQVPSKQVVGKLLWYGKHIGNHHLGLGTHTRKVDLFKGANMSFRRLAVNNLEFDRRLRGTGSAEDFAFSRAVSLAGWELLYDPLVLVDHYEGRRQDLRHYSSLQVTDLQGFEDYVHNLNVATWDSLSPMGHLASFLFFFFVGTRIMPGILQAVRFTPELGWGSWLRFAHAQKGRISALHTVSRSKTAKVSLL